MDTPSETSATYSGSGGGPVTEVAVEMMVEVVEGAEVVTVTVGAVDAGAAPKEVVVVP